MRSRQKVCSECDCAASVLFRIQTDRSQSWRFVCEACLLQIKERHPDYIYGGTWKAIKKR